MGVDPPHGTGPGKFSSLGRTADKRGASDETGGGGVGIPTSDDSYGEVGIQRDRGLYLKEEEQGYTIYCDAANSGTLQEDSAEDGGLSCSEVVRTGGA